MVLGKHPVLGLPINFDHSRARAYCACSGCGWGLFGLFFSPLSFLFSFSLSLGDGPIKTEILSQRSVKPKTTNQPTNSMQNHNRHFTLVCVMFFVHINSFASLIKWMPQLIFKKLN